MRVGIDAVALAGHRAGVARYLTNMLRYMVEAAQDSEFLLYAPRCVDVPLPPGNWHVRTPDGLHNRLPGMWLRRTVPEMIATDRIDVFWGQNTVLPLRLKRPCRRVLTVHDLTAVLYPGTMQVRRRLSSLVNFRAAVRAADRIIAVSQATARLARMYLGAAPSALHVVSEGYEDSFRPIASEQARELVMASAGIQQEFMLCVGTIEPRKNHLLLLRALELVPNPPLLAVAGGLGWKCGSILKEIRRQEAFGRVRYLGHVAQERLPALYSAAKLMVYPSVYEGFGLPVLEAMACGCPVLCSWSSSLPEVGGSAVRYFRPHDAEGLAGVLTQLLGDDGLLRDLSRLGRSRASQFSFRDAALQVLQLMR